MRDRIGIILLGAFLYSVKPEIFAALMRVASEARPINVI